MMIILILLCICQLVSCTVKGDRLDDGQLTEGQFLVVLYCECKSTQTSRYPKFHKDHCLQKKRDVCLVENDTSKRCLHFKKIVAKACESLNTVRQLNTKNYRVCGSRKKYKLFNKKKYLCCNGTVIKSYGGENQCCGQNIVNTSLVNCCHGKRYPRKSPTEICCGDNVYNTSTHFCYKDQMHKGNQSSLSNQSFVQEYDVNDPSTDLEIKDETVFAVGAKTELNAKNIAIISFLGVIVLIVTGTMYKCRRKRQYSDKDNSVIKEQPEISNCSIYDIRISDGHMSDTYQHTGICDVGNISSNRADNAIVRPGDTATTISPPATELASVVTAEVHSQVSQSNKDVKNNSSKRYSQDSLYSTITLNMSDFLKDLMKNDMEIKHENFVQNLMKESSTQTCGPKETNRRDVFGNPFQLSCFVTKDNPTIKMENSDAKMTISARDLKHQNIEVHSSSHTSLQEVRQKLDIKDEYHIISACMEYDLPAVETLEDYAVVELKLAGRLTGQINIWRMVTDNSLNDTFEVPIVPNHQRNIDTYCIIKNNMASIYTKVFSTYVCTRHTDGGERYIELWGVLYAKMSSNPIRATITLYIVDEKYIEIQDYKSRLDDSERTYGKLRRGHDRIPLPEEVTGKDKLEIKLSIDEREKWDFMEDCNNPGIKYDVFTHPICYISCQRKSIESCKCTWQMCNKTDMKPDIFKGHLYVKTENQQNIRAVFTVDELVTQNTDSRQLDGVRREISKSPVNSFDNNRILHKELDTLESTNSYKALAGTF